MKWTRIILPILFVFCLLTIFRTQQAMDRYRTPEQSLLESVYLPDGKILRVASLGFTSLIADLLWIKTVLYFGKYTTDEDNPYHKLLQKKKGLSPETGHHHNPQYYHDNHAANLISSLQKMKSNTTTTEHELGHDPALHNLLFDFPDQGMAPFIYPLLQRVVELDPHFIYPYQFGGFVVLLNTGEINKAYSLLKYGYNHNPNRWELPYYLGFIDLFYHSNSQDALKWISRTLVLPEHPEFLENLYLSIAHKGNNRRLMVDYLKGLYHSTPNIEDKQRIVELMQKLAGSTQ